MHQVKMEYVEVRSLFLIAFTFIEILKIGSQILKILTDRISSNSETLRKKDIYYANYLSYCKIYIYNIMRKE